LAITQAAKEDAMTPFQIGILLHYFCRPTDPEEQMRAPIWRETVNEFLNWDLLRINADSRRESTYAITPRGECYCRALQAMPLPMPRWGVTWQGYEEAQETGAVDPSVGARERGSMREKEASHNDV
jgi:hypothetical protein